MPLGIRWTSLRTKIIAWSFFPTMIILLIVAVVILFAYQQVTEDLVVERNRELNRLAAGQLSAELRQYAEILNAEAQSSAISGGNPVAQRFGLREAASRLVVFDAGTVILNNYGRIVAAEPERPEVLGKKWSDRTYYGPMLRAEVVDAPWSVFSDVMTVGPDGADVVAVAVPIISQEGQFRGMMAGMFHASSTLDATLYSRLVQLRRGGSGSTSLVDGQGNVIVHTGLDSIEDNPHTQPLVQRVLSGEVGAVRTSDVDGQDIVASFAPVPGTNWGLVAEESWAALTSSGRGYQQFLLLLLALGVLVPTLVVAVGLKRITRPITQLTAAAQRVARGDFSQTITAPTGDELEELAKQFNLMAGRLQASYAQMEKTVVDRTRELAAVNAIAAVVSQSLDLQEILDDALDKTLQVMGIEAGGIYLLEETPRGSESAGVLTIAAQRGFSPQFVTQIDDLNVGEGFSGRVAQTGQPLVVRDVSIEPRLTRMAVREEGLRSLAIVPLRSRGKVLGTLFGATRDYRQFSDQDVQLLTSIGHQIGIAVENARLFGQAEQRMQELKALYHADEEMHRHLDLDEVLQALVDVAVDTLKADKSSVLVWDEDQQRLVMRVARGFGHEAMALLSFAQGEGLAWQVFASGQPVVVGDAVTSPYRKGEREDAVQAVLSQGVRSLMHLPIRIDDEVFGVFNVCSGKPHTFGEAEQRLFTALGQRAALAIENAQLFNTQQRRAEQFRVISEVGRRITSIQPVDELLDQVVRFIQEAFGYYHVGIGLIEGEEVAYRVGAGAMWDDPEFQFEPSELKVGEEGITGWVAGSGEPLLVSDVSQEPRYVQMQGSATRSELAVPIKAKGEVIGVLDVQSDQPKAFDQSDLLVLQSLAHQTAIAIENAQLFKAEQRRAEQFRAVSEVGRHITAILDLDELLEQVASLVRETLNYYGVGIGLVEGDEVVFKAGAGASWNVTQIRQSLRLKMGEEGLAGWVAATGEPLLVPDVSQESRFYYVDEVSETRSEICVPLKAKGAVIGVLGAQADRLNAFDESDLAVLQALADQAATAIDNARLYERAQQLAVVEERQRLARELHDAVTQTLFSASLISEALPTLWENDQEEGRQLLSELRQLSRGALAEMRTLLLELRPAALADANLDGLFRQLGDAFTGRTGVPITVEVDAPCALPADVHVTLYRIAQEALNNVTKHADASQVTLSLRCSSIPADIDRESPAEVELLVQDDGHGFDPSSVRPDRLGLSIIRERAHAIGATLEIETAPGRGTAIALRWPFGNDLRPTMDDPDEGSRGEEET